MRVGGHPCRNNRAAIHTHLHHGDPLQRPCPRAQPGQGNVAFRYPVVVPRAIVRCAPDRIETGKRTVTLRFTATDSVDGRPITTGTVTINNKAVGKLGTPFDYQFEVYAVLDTTTRPPTWELPEGPDVVVQGMPGYANAAVHLTFWGHHTNPVRDLR